MAVFEASNESRVSVRLLWPLARLPAFSERLLELCSSFGVPARDFGKSDVRVPHRLLLRALEEGVRTTGDPLFGGRAGSSVEPVDFDVVEYAARSKPTLRDVVNTLSRFFRLLHGGRELELVDNGREAELRLHVTDGVQQPPAANDFVIAATATFLHRNSTPQVRPVRLAFAHTRPAYAAYYDCFEVDVVFDAPRDAIVLRTADLATPAPWPNADVARAFEREAEKLAETLVANDDVAGHVPGLVARLFDSGNVTMVEAARRLGVSVATLRRRIRRHGTTFNEIASDERRKLAERYLSKSSPSIGEIAFLLGFKNPSAFSRAFKKWRGVSPSEYRLNGTARGVALGQ